MRFILVTDGTWGDVLPFFYTAKELISRGHIATVFTNAYYEAYAKENNIPFVAATTLEFRKNFLSDPLLWHPTKNIGVIGKAAGTIFNESYAIIEESIGNTDAIISHSFTLAAKTLSEVYSLPYISLLYSPIQARSKHRLPILPGGKNSNTLPSYLKKFFYIVGDTFFLDPYMDKSINAKRKTLGLSRISSFVSWSMSDFLTIALWPEWYVQTESDQPSLRTTNFPKIEFAPEANQELATWMKKGEKPILVTMGSGYFFTSELKKILTELAEQYHERFLFVGLAETDDFSLPHFGVVSKVHFSTLLPSCKLFIHHGGAGTLALAVRSGIPQLIIPLTHDQPDNAFYIQKHGMGDALWTPLPPAHVLHEKINAILESKTIEKESHARSELVETEAYGITLAVDLIEKQFK